MYGLLEPFQSFDAVTVGVWYGGTTIAMIAMAAFLKWAGLESENAISQMIEDYGVGPAILLGAVAAPIIEELLFRGVPYFLSGSTTAILAGSIAWAALHKERAFIIVLSVPLYVKLWAGGFVEGAILVHVAHNALFICLFILMDNLGWVDDATSTA